MPVSSSILIGDFTLPELDEMAIGTMDYLLWFCDSSAQDDFISSIKNFERIDPNLDSNFNERKIDELIARNYKEIPLVQLRSKAEAKHIYKETMNLVSARIDTIFRARRTRSETGILRQNQIFSNLPNYFSSRVPKEWANLGRGSFALVIGAGPSLDITLPLLKSNLPIPLIIATDSSLRALESIGVQPDFVVSIDPNKSVSSCTNPGFYPGIVILSSQSHPSWSEKWKDRTRYLSGRVLTEDWLAEKGVSKTCLLVANNAGLSALALADYLSPSLIVTVGMDLSGGRGGSQRYAELTGRSHMEINAGHFHEIPGNYEKFVLTPFRSDWEETSKLSASIAGRRPILNFTDRGALLEGTTLIHPEDVKEMKNAINENIIDFSPPHELMRLSKAIGGSGLEQILKQMTTWCDYTWNLLFNDEMAMEKKVVLKKLLSNKDLALLLGDYSFAVMPLLNGEDTDLESVEDAYEQLKRIIWGLEDAILACQPSDQFLAKFFTEKFN